MPTIPLRSSPACLVLLLATTLAITAFGQYQDTSSESARGFSSDRVQANISDQGSGYGPNGPYGPYYARPGNFNQNRPRNRREEGQTDGLPDLGLALPGDQYLLNWYRRRSPGPSQSDLGVTWSEEDDRLVAREVAADSDLGRAGLQDGDEVVRVDAQRVRSQPEWQRVVDSIPAGQEVSIVVRREGNVKTLRWTPSAEGHEELPGPEDQRPPRDAESRPIKFITAARLRRGSEGRARLGVVMDKQVSDRAVLVSVEHGSAADEAGLRPNDVILSLSGRDIASPGELIRIVSQIKPGSSVELFVERPPVGSATPALGAGDRDEDPRDGSDGPALDASE